MLKFGQFCEELKKIEGTQYGSNPGGIHADEKGNKFYVKHYKNPDQAKSEALSGKIYKHMGVGTVDPEHRVIEGKHAIVSKWNEHLKSMQPHEFEKLSKDDHHTIGRMYHAAVLTKNWDAVGLEHDNVMRHEKTGHLHMVDGGGTFNFRAQGGHKDYGPDIAEHQSLRDHSLPAGHVFNHAFKQTPEAEHHGLEAVKKMDMGQVHKDFKESGISNWEDLHKSFVGRREKLLDHYSSKK